MNSPTLFGQGPGEFLKAPPGWDYRVVVCNQEGIFVAMDVARESAVTKAADQCLAALVRETLTALEEAQSDTL